jgi:peptidoglycan/LPS O-acetylase OafA/YrhL
MVDMIVRSKMGTNLDVLYNSTDTHGALMLMIGCFLATVVISDDALATPIIGPAAKYLAIPATIVAAALLTVTGARWRYEGGYVLIAVAFALLVVRALQRDRLTSPLTTKPLVWIGQRSYGLYLWHYPIGAFVRSQMNPDWMPPGVHRVIAVAVSVIVAAMSYRYFEQPIRKRVVGRASRPAAGAAETTVVDTTVIELTDSAMAACRPAHRVDR